MILNRKHKQVFDFIKKYSSSNGIAPTIREICEYSGLRSSSTIHAVLKKIESDGLIQRTREWRGIKVVEGVGHD